MSDFEAIDFTLKTLANITGKTDANKEFSDAPYGFYGPDGSQWYATKEEAAEQAQCAALEAGCTKLDILQKVGWVVIQPQVTFY